LSQHIKQQEKACWRSITNHNSPFIGAMFAVKIFYAIFQIGKKLYTENSMIKWSVILSAIFATVISFAAQKPTPILHYNNEVLVPGGSTLPYTIIGKWKVFTLVAEPVDKIIYRNDINTLKNVTPSKDLYKGKEMTFPYKQQIIHGWGYNGQIPGPAIVVHDGDNVRVIVKNHLPEPTTVHWHGLIVPNSEDGTGGTSKPPIAPGKTRVYQFTVHQEGTFMYHSGFNDTKQVEMGLGGFFIALPKNAQKSHPKDFAVMLQAFTLPTENSTPIIFSMDPNWFTFNGLSAPNIPVFKVHENDKVKIRFGNLSNMSHPIHLHGYTFNIIGTEGGVIPKSAQWPAATTNVAPGQTRTISFIANNPGLWRLHCHVLHHIVNDTNYWGHQKKLTLIPVGGMFTYLDVVPKQSDVAQ
jgi:FtsP/CotA-like multicopper oxidase with cupredoxin domain